MTKVHFPRRQAHLLPEDPDIAVTCSECAYTWAIIAGTPILLDHLRCPRCPSLTIHLKASDKTFATDHIPRLKTPPIIPDP